MREINFHLPQATVFWNVSYHSSLISSQYSITHTRPWLILNATVSKLRDASLVTVVTASAQEELQ